MSHESLIIDIVDIPQLGKEPSNQIVTKLKVTAGLADLVCGKYKAAAKQFLQANFDHVDFPEVTIFRNSAVDIMLMMMMMMLLMMMVLNVDSSSQPTI